MRNALKYLGWFIGGAASVSLCVTLRSQRAAPAESGPIQQPPSSPASPGWCTPKSALRSAFGHKTNTGRPPSITPRLHNEGNRRSHDDHHAAGDGPQVTKRATITGWVASASILATALVCLYCGVALRKEHAVPKASGRDSMETTLTEGAPSADHVPRVSLTQVLHQPLTSVGGGFAITLYNSGKGPAFDVRLRDIVRIEDANETPKIPLFEAAPDLAVGTMQPGAEFTTQVGYRTSPVTVAALRDGKVRAVSYTLVTFEDRSQRSHSMQQCFYWHSGLQSTLPCDQYTQME